LTALFNAGGIEGSANDMVTHAGEILDATSADQDDRMLLKIVTFTGDIRRDFDPVGETNAGDLTKSRVGLLGRRRVDADTNPTALRATLEGGSRPLVTGLFTA